MCASGNTHTLLDFILPLKKVISSEDPNFSKWGCKYANWRDFGRIKLFYIRKRIRGRGKKRDPGSWGRLNKSQRDTGEREFGDRSGRSSEIEKEEYKGGERESRGTFCRTLIYFCAVGCNLLLILKKPLTHQCFGDWIYATYSDMWRCWGKFPGEEEQRVQPKPQSVQKQTWVIMGGGAAKRHSDHHCNNLFISSNFTSNFN